MCILVCCLACILWGGVSLGCWFVAVSWRQSEGNVELGYWAPLLLCSSWGRMEPFLERPTWAELEDLVAVTLLAFMCLKCRAVFSCQSIVKTQRGCRQRWRQQKWIELIFIVFKSEILNVDLHFGRIVPCCHEFYELFALWCIPAVTSPTTPS